VEKQFSRQGRQGRQEIQFNDKTQTKTKTKSRTKINIKTNGNRPHGQFFG
jgi:hypothetical protein